MAHYFDSGPVITATLRFGAANNTNWNIPNDSTFKKGDLCIVTQIAENTTSTVPATVVPSGWSAPMGSSNTVVNDNGKGTKMVTLTHVLASDSEIGDSITGMLGAQTNRVCGIILHFSRPPLTYQVIDYAQNITVGDCPTQTVTWDNGYGTHLYWGTACALSATIADASFDWGTGPIGSAYDPNDTNSGKGSSSITRTYLSLYPPGVSPPSSETMNLISDLGAYNATSGMLLRFT